MIKKINVLFLLTLFFCLSVKSQDNIKNYVSFLSVEEPPIYPGCEGDKTELKDCFNKKVQKVLVKNFDSDILFDLNLKPGRHKAYIVFTVNTIGKIENIKVKASHKAIKNECIRAVKRIPKMFPGLSKSKKVRVQYITPLFLSVGETYKQRKKRSKQEKKRRN